MKLNTKHFGEIEINEKEILFFPDGILAFEQYKKFIILDTPDKDNPFQWLQCIDNPSLAFVIVNPFLFKKDYEFDIPQSVIEKLQIEKTEDVVVYTIVVVPQDITKMTTNLSGPLIINARKRRGKQIILDNNDYSTKYLILQNDSTKTQEE